MNERGVSAVPFAVRLAHARELVGRADNAYAGLPLHVVDQIDAARAETARFGSAIGRSLRLLDPSRGWRQHVEPADAEKSAYLVAALMACFGTVCPHLRRGGPQPLFARLPLKRVDCRRCVATVYRPPPGDADVCDVCGRSGVEWFVPFTIAAGATLMSGDACAACAAALGIGERERAS